MIYLINYFRQPKWLQLYNDKMQKIYGRNKKLISNKLIIKRSKLNLTQMAQHKFVSVCYCDTTFDRFFFVLINNQIINAIFFV
jgi:hypothetical protein